MGEIFENWCPYFMLYGMTYEQYWFGDPWIVKAYKQAYDLQCRKRNEELWLGGVYTLDAFSTVLSNAFRKKGTQAARYMSKPLDIFPKTKAEQEAEAEREREKVIRALTVWGKNWNRRYEQQDSSGPGGTGQPDSPGPGEVGTV